MFFCRSQTAFQAELSPTLLEHWPEGKEVEEQLVLFLLCSIVLSPSWHSTTATGAYQVIFLLGHYLNAYILTDLGSPISQWLLLNQAFFQSETITKWVNIRMITE